MIRNAIVAGTFYPGTKSALSSEIKKLLSSCADKTDALGVVAPHAGYMYSGKVAGAVYGGIAIPDEVLILCPNHTGLGVPLSLWPDGAWETPLGRVEVDERLNTLIGDAVEEVEEDTLAHLQEHSAEVQIPFLQYCLENVKISVIVVAPFGAMGGTHECERLVSFGRTVGQALKNYGSKVLVVASSDMTHYESRESVEAKDGRAIGCIERLDPEGLFAVVKRERITMCGYAPTVIMLSACRELGASGARLAKYATSGEASGDYERVVGYAGMIVR